MRGEAVVWATLWRNPLTLSPCQERGDPRHTVLVVPSSIARAWCRGNGRGAAFLQPPDQNIDRPPLAQVEGLSLHRVLLPLSFHLDSQLCRRCPKFYG
jgi:hypothetical protein